MVHEHLPSVDLDFVKHAEDEYHSIYRTGTAEEVESARFRLIWALVHSTRREHHARGLELCRTKLQEQERLRAGDGAGAAAPSGQDATNTREYRYFAAVACYNMGSYIQARRELLALLQESRGFRQAEFLRGLVDDAIVREGLLGVGVGAAVAGVAVALVMGLASRK